MDALNRSSRHFQTLFFLYFVGFGLFSPYAAIFYKHILVDADGQPAIGLIGLIWGGISWTEEETLVDIGPIEASAEQEKTVPITPLVGGVALVAGIVLLVIPSRRR